MLVAFVELSIVPVVLLLLLLIVIFRRSWLRRHALARYAIVLLAGMSVATGVFFAVTDTDAIIVRTWRVNHDGFDTDYFCIIPPAQRNVTPCPPNPNEFTLQELMLRARIPPMFSKACYSDDPSVCAEVNELIREVGSEWTNFWRNGFGSIVAGAVGVLVFGLITPSHKKKKGVPTLVT